MADTFRVGDWFVEPQLNTISAGGKSVHLEPKVMQVLVCLASHPDEVVSKERLIQTVWKDTFVSDDVLTRSIGELRRAFGDDAKESRFIQTIPKSGYRLVAPVTSGCSENKSISHETGELKAFPSIKPRSRLRNPRVIAACLMVLAIAAMSLYVWKIRRAAASGKSNTTKSIAVLPFKSVGPEVGDEYLGLEMADTLITRLSSTKQLVVCPPGPARKYRGKDQDPIAAGRDLSMDLVLDGSLHRTDDRVRVTVRLLRVADGSAVFAERYDEKFADIFDVEDRVAEKVARSLALSLTSEEKELLTKRYTENTQAYRLYVLGRYFVDKGTKEGYKKGIEYFNEALRIEPRYALAYSALAGTYSCAAQMSFLSPKEVFLNAKEAALKALEIDPSLAEAHSSLGTVKWMFEYDWADAEASYKRGVELDPLSTLNRVNYAGYLATLGRHDEALAEMSRPPEPSATDIFCKMVVGQLFYFSRRYDRVIQQVQNTLELEPDNPLAHFWLGMAYEQKEMYENAIVELQKVNSVAHDPFAMAGLGHCYAVSGKKAKAKELIQQLETESKQSHAPPFCIAVIYAGLGEKDTAFEWLEKEYADRSGGFVLVKVDPRFDPLRSDPRFGNLLARAGIPQ